MGETQIFIDELAVEEWAQEETIQRVRGLYEFRRHRFKVRAGKVEAWRSS